MGSRTAILFYRTDNPEGTAGSLADRYGLAPHERHDTLETLFSQIEGLFDREQLDRMRQGLEASRAEHGFEGFSFPQAPQPEAFQQVKDWELPHIIQGRRFVSLTFDDVIRNDNFTQYVLSESQAEGCPVFGLSNYDDFLFDTRLSVEGELRVSTTHVLYEDDDRFEAAMDSNVIQVDFTGTRRAVPQDARARAARLLRDTLGLEAGTDALEAFFVSDDADEFEEAAEQLTGIPFRDLERLQLKRRLPYGLWYLA